MQPSAQGVFIYKISISYLKLSHFSVLWVVLASLSHEPGPGASGQGGRSQVPAPGREMW